MTDYPGASISPEEPICVVTRITFGRWWSLPGAIRRFWKLRRLGRKTIPGLVDAHLHIRRDATLIFISLWQDELALLQFTTLDPHVEAVRWTIRRRGLVWSGLFRLTGNSSMSEPWIGTVRQWEPLTPSPPEKATVDGPLVAGSK